ncbi:hypothetical protein GCM10007392_40740 [Saccharospirillum salsuginis]|uniref:Transposase n=2 Tax=Saccharospirillum salsuginis TaxID=418750 RepID=A0A918NI02_9GAMM|nr:hypothetical protein GCM10007392_40740 [Saccharospirillum salsuginis]
MKQDRLIAIDLAKNVFQLCVIDGNNRVLENKAVRRYKLITTMARRKPCIEFASALFGRERLWLIRLVVY